MRNALFIRLLAGLFCLVLASCFDIHEEAWIEGDGSGRAELRYTVPESALMLTGGAGGLEKKIRELVATQPPLTLDEVTVTVDDKQARVVVKISTESMLSLLDLQKSESFESLPSATNNLAGHFDVRLRWLDLDFSRSVQVGDALGLASLAIGADDKTHRRLTYIIHLPKPAKESNATSVTDGGRTLRWDSTLGDAMKKPLVTRFRATMPVPLWIHVSAGVLLAGVPVLALRLRGLRRRRV